MNFLRKNNIFILSIICLVLTITINVTYSKFTYSKELSGNIVTIKPPTFSESLIELARNNLDTNVNFGSASSEANGIGLMMRDGTQNDEYPIVYYRGDITNNSVIFANLCWLIVRTTETGGIKLVFNGPTIKNADGTESCSNYSGVGGEEANTSYNEVFAGSAQFNSSSGNPLYVGYMYNNDTYNYSKDTYFLHLSDNTIDSTTGHHVQNLKDSKVKELIDTWYETNILGKTEESLLEDTVWCNDRSVIDETYSLENFTNGTNSNFDFAAYTRLYENSNTTGITPSLECTRDMDKFTTDSENGNGDLDYPIGMLTADEINLAGYSYSEDKVSIKGYLHTSATAGGQWTLSPSSFESIAFVLQLLNQKGLCKDVYVATRLRARPSISLKNTTLISSGNGSYEQPYIVVTP